MFQFVYHNIAQLIKAAFNLSVSAEETVAIIGTLENDYHGVFEKSAIKKATRFQGVQQVFINDPFANLMGRDTNNFERTSNKYYFLLTGLYDDIIDQKLISEKELDQLFIDPINTKATIFETKILVDIHLNLLKRVKNINEYKATLSNVHQAQKDSLKQFDQSISKEEILDITLRKGGYSLLMCRHYIDLPISDELNEAWYQLGGIIQITNDLYDIHKDLQEGICTLPNSIKKVEDIELLFKNLVTKFFQTLSYLPFDQHKIKTLKIKLSVIPAFGFIAIKNLWTIHQDYKVLPDLNNIPRKDLIIDMEKPINRLKLIQEAYKVYKTN
jgi:hypothetical protein